MASKIKDLPFIPSEANVFLVKREVPTNTEGAPTIGKVWSVVYVNSVEGDTSLASITANQITIQPGTYVVKIFHEQNAASGVSACRLYDVDNSLTAIKGSSNIADDVTITMELQGILTVNTATTYEIQVYKASSGTLQGVRCNYGNEVFVTGFFLRL